MEWKPIETAPRDGRLIDIWYAHQNEEGRMPDCHWSPNGYWIDEGGTILPEEDALFWMNQPAPPEA